jgi:hypothetical protein
MGRNEKKVQCFQQAMSQPIKINVTGQLRMMSLANQINICEEKMDRSGKPILAMHFPGNTMEYNQRPRPSSPLAVVDYP